ncbi:MAG: response regulator [Bacteroidetes bacterium]|nr:response regulator [Bacteroidota bacterium]MBP6316150.1 response regulator [Chitinophagaceae bacterium]
MEENIMLENVRFMFIIDDDPVQTEMIKDYLGERYIFELKTFQNGEEALPQVEALKPEIVVLDYHLSANNAAAKNGVEILKEIKKISPATKVVMFSGQDNINIALDSMRNGAYDYIIKGETAFNKMETTVNRLGEMHKLESINTAQKRTIMILSIVIAAALALGILYFFFGDPQIFKRTR